MKIVGENKWHLGIAFLLSPRRELNRKLFFYQGWIVFALTLFVVGVCFGEISGIKPIYLTWYRYLAAGGFFLALLPVAAEATGEWRARTLNIPTIFTMIVLLCSIWLSLFFRF